MGIVFFVCVCVCVRVSGKTFPDFRYYFASRTVRGAPWRIFPVVRVVDGRPTLVYIRDDTTLGNIYLSLFFPFVVLLRFRAKFRVRFR